MFIFVLFFKSTLAKKCCYAAHFLFLTFCNLKGVYSIKNFFVSEWNVLETILYMPRPHAKFHQNWWSGFWEILSQDTEGHSFRIETLKRFTGKKHRWRIILVQGFLHKWFMISSSLLCILVSFFDEMILEFNYSDKKWVIPSKSTHKRCERSEQRLCVLEAL